MSDYTSNGLSEHDKEERNSQVNKEYRGYPTLEAYKLAQELEKLTKEKEDLVRLTEQIDKQPIINLNDVRRRTRGKEDKLPRKLRAGWK